ncbi:MAG: hypothetical protein H0T43_03015 [Solirubrobacterales bacterium]|nr:hypothetical protein [Solirubrobacterales bacterium]
MARPARPASAGALLLVLAALAGCGGDSSENTAYVDQVNAAQAEFAATVSQVSREITSTSSAREDQRTLARFEGAIDGVVGDLRRIDVPTDVRPEHDRLVSAMTGFGDDIEVANAALRRPSRRTLADAQRTISRATMTVNSRINAAIGAINDKLGV